jgi:hypothetical protein
MKFEKGGASSATLFFVIRPLASRRFDRGDHWFGQQSAAHFEHARAV